METLTLPASVCVCVCERACVPTHKGNSLKACAWKKKREELARFRKGANDSKASGGVDFGK